MLRLVKNLCYLTCSNGTATLADCETESFIKSDRGDELDVDLNVIARHNHFYTLGESNLTGNIKCTDEELRTILVVERSVTATLLS